MKVFFPNSVKAKKKSFFRTSFQTDRMPATALYSALKLMLSNSDVEKKTVEFAFIKNSQKKKKN